jgi:hypothetical protein
VVARRSDRADAAGAAAPQRFRIHAVEASSGKKNTFLATCDSEQAASDQALEQLGDAWQILFVERA